MKLFHLYCNIFDSFFYSTASLITEIKTQEDKKKKEEKEILKDLDVVKEKANEVLLKLGL